MDNSHATPAGATSATEPRSARPAPGVDRASIIRGTTASEPRRCAKVRGHAGYVGRATDQVTHGRPTTWCPVTLTACWRNVIEVATSNEQPRCGKRGGGERTGSGVKVVKAADRAPDSHAPFSACGSHDLMLHKDDRTGALQATSRRRAINVTLTPSFSSEIPPQRRTLSSRYIRKTRCAAIRFRHDLRLVWHFFHRTS